MKVKLARTSGFCGDGGKFGVSGAIRLATEAAVSNPDKVYLVGDLVHNNHVTEWLRDKYGIKVVNELEKVPAKATLIIKAHGALPSFWQAAREKKLNIIDATCPMVRAAQQLVRQLIDEGKEIIYVASEKKHDEAVSVSGQVEKGVKVVTLAEVDNLKIKHPENTVVLTQTTLSILETREKFAALTKKYPALTISPHLCQATTQRQEAVLELAQEVDLLIVVGAPHSSNSQRLLEVARTSGKTAYAVNDAGGINEAWFDHSVMTVGVIAGASTPAWITKEVVEKIESYEPENDNKTNVLPLLFRTGIGQDSHRLRAAKKDERLYLGGVPFECGLTVEANSDGDVILHALCNALSTAIGGGSLSTVADELCQKGVKDSREYTKVFLAQVAAQNYTVGNVSIAVEAGQPQLEPYADLIRKSLARILRVDAKQVGVAFTSGEELTAFGKGEGIACMVSVLLQHK